MTAYIWRGRVVAAVPVAEFVLELTKGHMHGVITCSLDARKFLVTGLLVNCVQCNTGQYVSRFLSAGEFPSNLAIMSRKWQKFGGKVALFPSRWMLKIGMCFRAKFAPAPSFLFPFTLDGSPCSCLVHCHDDASERCSHCSFSARGGFTLLLSCGTGGLLVLALLA